MPRGARSSFTLACLMVGVALLLAACGGAKIVGPFPNGALPKQVVITGNATAGKAVFTANGCGACHAFTAAAATGKVGPNLDDLTAEAGKAGQPLADFVKSSITDPGAYIAPGFAAGIMPTTFGQTLKPQQLADLVAFLTQGK